MKSEEYEGSWASAYAHLREADRILKRLVALQKMSEKNNPYYPLVRVMCKLKLIKDWNVFR
jgi:hypothetical protein